MSNGSLQRIYLDTNVYARSFDDQTQPTIQTEANAFLEIIQAIEAQKLVLLSSDILTFEVDNILDSNKRTKVETYLKLCNEHIDSSDEILHLGKQIQSDCHLRPRDALHIASAIVGQARYFLSCDRKVAQIEQVRCYRRFARTYRQTYFSVMNPVLFVEKLQKGDLE
ncbi:MAG: PIN domain-containing protein [Anaerolineae bacterium]|nr:PIN domain-containing protein [Anaerolineae bacterium]